MDRSTAMTVWRQLEEARDTEFEGDPPTYDVRLDATVAYQASERAYRVRVAPAKGMGGVDRDAWQYVVETAVEHDTGLDVDNNALVLT